MSKHDLGSFLRAIDISNKELFIFVEGRDSDPYVYSNIIHGNMTSLGIDYEVLSPSSIMAGHGGKDMLLDLLIAVKARSGTNFDFKGKKKSILFFLDKDVDDFRGTMLNDSAVVYTAFYNIENHIVKESDLVKGLGIAGSLPVNLINDEHVRQILRNIYEKTKGHIVKCHHVVVNGYMGAPNFRENPKVNYVHSNVEIVKMALEKGIAQDLVVAEIDRSKQIIDQIYMDMQHDTVFNGKWYYGLLESEISRLFPNNGCSKMIHAIRAALTAHMTCDKLRAYYAGKCEPAIRHLRTKPG